MTFLLTVGALFAAFGLLAGWADRVVTRENQHPHAPAAPLTAPRTHVRTITSAVLYDWETDQ